MDKKAHQIADVFLFFTTKKAVLRQNENSKREKNPIVVAPFKRKTKC